MEADKKDVKSSLPSRVAKKPIYFVLKDVLLDDQVYWKPDSTTVFGFAWGKGVHAVIPWGKLGLSLEEKRGKFSIISSEGSEVKTEEEEMADAYAPSKPVVLDVKKHKFVLRHSKRGKQWTFMLSENSLLRFEHLPAVEHDCHCISGWKLRKKICKKFCWLKHGDYVKISWAVFPSEAHKREELVFAFYDHGDTNEEPKRASILSMPDTVLSQILICSTPKEYLKGIGLTAPKLTKTLEGNVPWKKLDLCYTLDSFRSAKLASAGSLTSLTFKVASVSSIRYAGPEQLEFVERFYRLLSGTNLVSLHLWDTTLLHNAPTPPNLKTFKLTNTEGLEPLKDRLKSLTEASVEQVQLSSVHEFNSREFFDSLPKVRKLQLKDCPPRAFWRYSTKAHMARITHLSFEVCYGSSSLSRECPILFMENLEHLVIHNWEVRFSDFRFNHHERLRTLSVSNLTFHITEPSPIWTNLATAAPNLENLRISGEFLEDDRVAGLAVELRKLRFLAIFGASISMATILGMVRDLPQFEYLRVDCVKIDKNEVACEEFLAHVGPDCTLEWTWTPGQSWERRDLSFLYTKLAPSEAETAEDVFKF